MRHLLAGAMLIIATAVSASAYADGDDPSRGNFWYSHCANEQPFECAALIMGLANGISGYQNYMKTQALYCLPKNNTYRQLTDVFLGYLKRHPEERHLNVSMLFMASMVEAFPCNAKR